MEKRGRISIRFWGMSAYISVGTNLDGLLVVLFMHLKVPQLEPFRPITFVQVHEHGLFQLGFSIVDRYGVVMSVEAMDEGLNGGLVDVTNV